MPAKSKAQQRFFGMVDAYKKGELENPSKAIKDAAESMSKKEVKKFAKTKHKGLPEHVKHKKSKSNKVKLNESELIDMIREGVEAVLNEISYDLAKKAYAKNYDKLSDAYWNKDTDYAEKQRLKKRDASLYRNLKDRANQRMNPDMDAIVCSREGCKRYKAGELEKYFEISGVCEPSENPIYNDGKCVGYPRLRGFVGPMWDGDKIRYETQEVYDALSI